MVVEFAKILLHLRKINFYLNELPICDMDPGIFKLGSSWMKDFIRWPIGFPRKGGQFSETRLGDLLHFGQLLKACGNNYFAQIAQIFRNFCKVVKICRFSSEIIFVQLFTGHTGGHYDIITNLFPPKRFTIISTFHSPRDLSCRESNVKCFFKKIKHFFSDLYTMKTSSRIVWRDWKNEEYAWKISVDRVSIRGVPFRECFLPDNS